MGEVELAGMLCAFLAGSEAEARHYFDVHETRRHVRVDCTTDSHVIEIGLDGKSSSRDSVHQALFFSHLTGKTPVVVLIDRDGHVGRFEHEMQHVTAAAGVLYLRCSEAAITRWATTAPMRDAHSDDRLDDLPQAGVVRGACDLAPLAGNGQVGS
ncbi:hypothetical protein [Roseovarius salis]|uniref:hypothetical protein n=1 Tax=Roseovarius salis TaxID=3376063 RepID=UPI0037C5F846